MLNTVTEWWRGDLSTLIGVALVIFGLSVDVFGARLAIPSGDQHNAATGLISAGLLLITPRRTDTPSSTPPRTPEA